MNADRSSLWYTARQVVRCVFSVRRDPTVFRGDNPLFTWYTAYVVAASTRRGAQCRAGDRRRKVIGEEECAQPDANI